MACTRYARLPMDQYELQHIKNLAGVVHRLGFEQELEALTWQTLPLASKKGLVETLLSKAAGSGLAGLGLDAPAQARTI